MPKDEFQLEIDFEGCAELFNSAVWAQALDTVGNAIVAAAVPHTGVDTGRLIGSMSHAVVKGDEVLEVVMGSGVGDDVAALPYAEHHWADAKPGTEGRPGYPGESWKGTKPWIKAFEELGIEWEILPGGYEV